MKFYARRVLKLLIGLTIIAMLYLIFKTHSGGSTLSGDINTNSRLQDMIKNFFSGDVGNVPFMQIGKRNMTVDRLAVDLVAPFIVNLVSPSVVSARSHDLAPVNMFRSFWNKVPYRGNSRNLEGFVSWASSADDICDGFITGYHSNFLYATDMIIDKRFCKCKMKGGEPIGSVVMQDEGEEYYKYDMGCFKAKCSGRPSYIFKGNNHLNKWMMSLSVEDTKEEELTEDFVVKDFTIAVTRYEYANLYHTMTDWYNAFLIKEFFNHTSFDTNILFIDAHPSGTLDKVWSHLFNSTQRLSSLPTRTRFKKLAWGILGYNSPMGITVTNEKIPLFEEFRSFFLDSYGIREEDLHKHGCKVFNILFIWRHNYVAHPRNPNGSIPRKIANEMELVNYMKQKLPKTFRVKGSQIDVFEMREQLEMVTWADILIGMHGAGLTHTLFLKKNSALIELTPSYMFGEEHFAAIANWRNIVYTSWSNNDPLRELPDKYTIIPPSVVFTLIKKSVKDLCSPTAYHALFPQSTGNSSSSNVVTPP